MEISFSKILLGKVIIDENLEPRKYHELSGAFQAAGLEIIETRANKLVKDIKRLVREYVDLGIDNQSVKLSSFLSSRIMLEFDYLSSLFSANSGETIERYFIFQRIEKVKELIIAGQHSLVEVAYETGFSSVHHLSGQFKKVTGITPSQYKLQENQQRAVLPANTATIKKDKSLFAGECTLKDDKTAAYARV